MIHNRLQRFFLGKQRFKLILQTIEKFLIFCKISKMCIRDSIIICLCSCGKSSKKVSITGEIKGLGTDTLYLYGMDESFDRIDTIFAKNDKFSYTASIDTITSAFLLIDNQTEYPIFLDKGNQITIKGDINHQMCIRDRLYKSLP